MSFSPRKYPANVLFTISTSPRLLAGMKLIVAPLRSWEYSFDMYVAPEPRLGSSERSLSTHAGNVSTPTLLVVGFVTLRG